MRDQENDRERESVIERAWCDLRMCICVGSTPLTLTSHLYVCLEVEQVNLLPVTTIQGQDIPRLRREKERKWWKEEERVMGVVSHTPGLCLGG